MTQQIPGCLCLRAPSEMHAIPKRLVPPCQGLHFHRRQTQIGQAGLEFRDPSAAASRVVGLKACPTSTPPEGKLLTQINIILCHPIFPLYYVLSSPNFPMLATLLPAWLDSPAQVFFHWEMPELLSRPKPLHKLPGGGHLHCGLSHRHTVCMLCMLLLCFSSL